MACALLPATALAADRIAMVDGIRYRLMEDNAVEVIHSSADQAVSNLPDSSYAGDVVIPAKITVTNGRDGQVTANGVSVTDDLVTTCARTLIARIPPAPRQATLATSFAPACCEMLEKGQVIPKLSHNCKDGVCTVCGAKDPDFKPEIIEGADGAWQKGAGSGLGFTFNAAFADFKAVQVDGKDVDKANYEVKEGSTIVILKASYLETFSVGKHTLAIVSSASTATTTFMIQAASTGKPTTGDDSAVILWAALAVPALGGAAVLTVRKKRTER